MTPRILARSDHTVSRKDIDPDALKVLYRLKNHGYLAYLVGGGVRDLLLKRRPKDFDIGTNAHPQQVKRLFRNCFIVGRRFRLCHVRFGRKVIEVSTFRRQAESEQGDTLIRRDNTFGSPREDAFRRDFTVNALFYDLASFSVIDYVGGLEDLEQRVIRTIGDPVVRLREDPVRMLRAVALACRLDFTIDRDTREAIHFLRGEIVKSSAARLLEEVYKILRQGAARASFLALHETGLLAYLLPEAERAMRGQDSALLDSLGRLDAYRSAGLASGEQVGNTVLLGSLLVPLGVPLRGGAAAKRVERNDEADAVERPPEREEPVDVAAELAALGATEAEEAQAAAPQPAAPVPLTLPFARRDLDRLRLILFAQRRLLEVDRPLGMKQTVASRPYFDEALRWLEIHGGADGQQLAAHWRSLDLGDMPPPPTPLDREPRFAEPTQRTGKGRRRRRRRRRRPGPPPSPTTSA
jgi:poly(A) polymerase